MKYDELQLKVNAELQQLELEIDGHVAFIKYKISDHHLFLIHTEVPPELQGKGAGNAIIEKALQYAKQNDYKIIPICPFVRAYLKRHPEWNYIVAEDAEQFIH